MPTLPHSHAIMQQRGECIRFVQSMEDGKPCWFYLRVHPEKLAEYEEKMQQGNLHIREYGHILESNWGVYPPDDVIGFMKDEYDFDTPPDVGEG